MAVLRCRAPPTATRWGIARTVPPTYLVMTQIVMRYASMARVVMAYIVMARVIMVHLVMACIVTAHVVMARIVMARGDPLGDRTYGTVHLTPPPLNSSAT